jgi:hypothetical protein
MSRYIKFYEDYCIYSAKVLAILAVVWLTAKGGLLLLSLIFKR